MENHIISKGEREREFLGIKENKSYIFNPMEASGFHGVNIMDLQLRFTLQIYIIILKSKRKEVIYMHAGIFLSACVITVGLLVVLETLSA